jgi:hypothetical protein
VLCRPQSLNPPLTPPQCCYIILLVLLNISSHYATNEFHPDLLESILADPEEVRERIFGSKIVVGSNQAYLMTLWGVKACLLMLYNQMTKDTRNNVFVKIVMAYTAIGLIAIEIPYFFVLCRPFSQYWALPVDNPQCANYFYYCIIQMVFNVSSDFLMLLIPLPLIINAKVPPLKRALLIGIFSLGLFVILAAILNKAYNFSMPNTTVYMVWHIREASVSIYVANIMCLWPLLRKIFGWKRFLQRSSNGGEYDEMGGSRRSQAVVSEPHSMGTPLRDVKPSYRPSSSPVSSNEKGFDHDVEVGEIIVYGRAY